MSDDLPSNKVPTNRLPASALPYGIDTIVIPFTWSDPPKRRLPGNDQSPPRGMDYLETIEYNRARAREMQRTSAEVETLSVAATDVAMDNSEIPALDDNGNAIIGGLGSPIRRPKALDPNMFVAAGLEDKQFWTTALALPAGYISAVRRLYERLKQFDRFGPWDAQRFTGKFDSRYVDYATVAIGLYAAAAGIPRAAILEMENYIARSSDYEKGTGEHPPMDGFYTHLPNRNVRNTDIGYELYSSGRVQAVAPNRNAPIK